MSSNNIFYIVIGAFTVLVAIIIAEVIKHIRRRPLPMDEMEGHDFEYYCAELLDR